MSRKDRYTERNRPHRREVGSGSAPPAEEGLSNPVVLIAVGGLLVAMVLAVAVFIGRSMAEGDTATAPDAVPTVAEPAATTADEVAAATSAPPADDGESAAGGADDTESEAPDEGASMPSGQYAAPEPQNLNPEENSYFATIETEKGTMKAELWPGLAPETVNSFVFLAREGFFDGLTFHRVEAGFVIQGGDPEGGGTGGPGYAIPGEFSDVPHVAGILSMARTQDPNSAGSQFFVVLGDAPHLNDQYAVFGYVYEGFDVAESIAVNDRMTKVTIEEKPASESIVSPDDVREGNLPDNS